MSQTAFIALLAALSAALAEVTSRVALAAVAAALVYAAGQLAGGAPAGEIVTTFGWIALSLTTARLAFTAAVHLLADVGDQAEAVTA